MRKLIAVVFLVGGMWSQDIRGRIAGRVTDASAAAMPNVEVSAVNPATNTKTSALTNDAGAYELPYLNPGVYTVSVAAPGFKKYDRSNLEVRAGDRLQLDIALELGQTTESITVSGQASLLETSTASLGQVVDQKRILELPLPGGNALSLARLAPGVQNLSAPNHPSLGPAVEVLSSLSVNGVRAGNIEFTVDGTPSMWGQNAAYAPPTEMVAEFKVQTATYDASLGRSPGGNVNVVLRSGANKPHLSLYEFHNNQVLQSMDLFQRQFLYSGEVNDFRRAQANPRNILNRYGASASGPVVIPKLYDGRNKTFAIYGFERLTRPGVERGSIFFTVPELDQRQGDFSRLLRQGAAFQVFDPGTIRAEGANFRRDPFPGNVIPRNRLDATAQRLMNFFPTPNTAGAADGRNNYSYLQRSYNEFNSHTAKVDHNISQKHRIFGRYNQTYNLFTSGVVFPENNTTGRDRFRYNYGFGFDDVYVISPRLLLNTRYGFTRFEQTFTSLSAGFDLASAGFNPALANAIEPAARTFPQLAVQGMQTLGGQWPTQAINNYHTWASDLNWQRGRHNIRLGGEFRLYREHNYNFTSMAPQMTFGNLWTRGPLDTSAGAPIGQGTASFLLGLPSDGQINVNDSFAEQSTTTGFYLQDDWRVNSRLTVNAGIRYDYDGPGTERFNRAVRGFAFDTPNPIAARAIANYAANPIPELPVNQFRVNGGLTFAGVNGQPRTLWRADRNNFAPRIGLAWTPVAKTVIRTGYGIFYVPLGVDRFNVNQSGYSIRNLLVPTIDNIRPFATLQNPFPNGFDLPPGARDGLATDVGRAINFFNERPKNGYQQRFSFGVQRELPWHTVIDVSYVGNRGTALPVNRPFNPVPNDFLSRSPVRDQATITRLTGQVNNPFFPLPGTDLAGRTVARSQLLRPYPHYSGVGADAPIGYSWFHSLQTFVERRFRNGMTFQVNHTYSKMMEANGFLNGGDARLEEVISDLDRTHRVTASGIWELPWFRKSRGIAKQTLGDWQVQAVWQRTTGGPMGLPNAILTNDIRNLPAATQTLDTWFNTSIFERNPANQLGQNVRTLNTRFSGVRQPGTETWDLSAVKNWKVKESWTVQLRGEFLNALNRSNFANATTDPTSALFGRVTATTGFPRYIHLGLKVIY